MFLRYVSNSVGDTCKYNQMRFHQILEPLHYKETKRQPIFWEEILQVVYWRNA